MGVLDGRVALVNRGCSGNRSSLGQASELRVGEGGPARSYTRTRA